MKLVFMRATLCWSASTKPPTNTTRQIFGFVCTIPGNYTWHNQTESSFFSFVSSLLHTQGPRPDPQELTMWAS
ncbi:hypothetical protein B0H14DRAFT_2882392 [Mycena olivaceomarginata]|nr:hypothetical protein B0H14DRAFT_2882392 [Mycena olivaceomarginata]